MRSLKGGTIKAGNVRDFILGSFQREASKGPSGAVTRQGGGLSRTGLGIWRTLGPRG